MGLLLKPNLSGINLVINNMIIVPKNEGSWSGVHINKSSMMISVVRGNKNLTNIYIGYGTGFNIWIEDCPIVRTDKEVLNVFIALDVLEKFITSLSQLYYELGQNAGRKSLQYELKELLDID